MVVRIVARVREADAGRLEEALRSYRGLYYVGSEEGVRTYTFYVDEAGVDGLLELLIGSIDLRYRENVIEVSRPEVLVSSYLKRRLAQPGSLVGPVEALLAGAEPYTRLDRGRLAMTGIASLVALAGLLLDNPVVVIGAMLLSPLLGPIYAFTVNTVVGSPRSAARSLAVLAAMLSLAVALPAVASQAALHLGGLGVTHELEARASVGAVDVGVALLLGAATMVSAGAGESGALVGVAIAAALVPPAAALGAYLALDPSAAYKPLLLLLVNITGLMLGSLAAALLLGVSPRRYYEKRVARIYTSRALAVLAALLLALTLLTLAAG